MQFQAGFGGFKVPRGYRFVRQMPNQFASEYYLIPFHWPARLYWRVYFAAWKIFWNVLKWYAKKKKKIN